jgi:hypothetical protein
MLVPTALVVIVLLLAVLGGLYIAKRRVVDREEPPDIRPDDRKPTARVSL